MKYKGSSSSVACALILILTSVQLRAAESAEQWRNDIDVLTSELKRVHPRFRECGLTPEIEQAARSLAQRVEKLDDAQVVVEMQRLLASAGDGHTLLLPFGMKQGKLLRIPLMLWLFDDGLYVVDASQQKWIGQKVTQIGSLTAQEALKKIEPYLSTDNDQQKRWAAPFYCTLSDFLLAIGALTTRNSVQVTFGDGKQETFSATDIDPEHVSIKLIAPKTGKIPEYLAHLEEPFRAEQIRPGVLYVALNSMSDSPQKTLAAFGKELTRQLAPYQRAIIDLRLNNGGEAMKADELFKTLVAFDNRGGRLMVLLGRMTFSAAQTFATRIDQWTDAVFVGEESGSRPNHYGNERPFKLPYSGVRGMISSGLNQPVTARDERLAIVPELIVRSTSADYFAGTDRVLDVALDALNKPRP